MKYGKTGGSYNVVRTHINIANNPIFVIGVVLVNLLHIYVVYTVCWQTKT